MRNCKQGEMYNRSLKSTESLLPVIELFCRLGSGSAKNQESSWLGTVNDGTIPGISYKHASFKGNRQSTKVINIGGLIRRLTLYPRLNFPHKHFTTR